MPAIITFGLYVPTNGVIHINDAKNGLACDCICINCETTLVANQGYTRDWYYSHYTESQCLGGLETALHKLAKQIIVENNEITLPKFGKIAYSNGISETPLEKFIPDVTARLIDEDIPIYFEVYHCHKNSTNKDYYYYSSKLKSVEIEMSKCPLDSIDSIKHFVLKDPNNKRIIYWDDDEKILLKPKVENTKLVVFAGLLVLISLVYCNWEKIKKLFKKRL